MCKEEILPISEKQQNSIGISDYVELAKIGRNIKYELY